MSELAAHLVDHGLPHVPIRQWVFTVPVPVRSQLAFDAALTRAVLRVFVRLAALVPPPRRPWLASHGGLASRARWRATIVPAPREDTRAGGPAAAPGVRDRDPRLPALWRSMADPGGGDRAGGRAAPVGRPRARHGTAAGPPRHGFLTRRRFRRPSAAASLPVGPLSRGGGFRPRVPEPLSGRPAARYTPGTVARCEQR